MRFTIAAGAIAAATFAATFVLAPYAENLGDRLSLEKLLAQPSTASQPVAAQADPECSAAFGRVLAALASKSCD